METTSQLKNIRISAQKCRLVADQIRGLSVSKARNLLVFSNKKAAEVIKKVLESAISNAEHNEGADIDELKISKVFVDVAPVQKRFRARARGRGDRILKRSSHITVAVSDQ